MTKMMMVFASSRLESGVGWNGGFSWRLLTPPSSNSKLEAHQQSCILMMRIRILVMSVMTEEEYDYELLNSHTHILSKLKAHQQ